VLLTAAKEILWPYFSKFVVNGNSSPDTEV